MRGSGFIKEYIVKLQPFCRKNIKKYGTIIFESTQMDGLIGLDTDLPIDKIKRLPYVISVKESEEGEFIAND